jgi:uncharacterized membrane protein
MMWSGHFDHGAGWEGWLMFLFMIIFAVAAVVAIIYLVRYVAQPQVAQTQTATPPAAQYVTPSAFAPAPESPQDILKRRYAAGEIEREEYLQKLGDL